MSQQHSYAIDELDDESLFREVRRLKPEAGPVVDSTRSLYRKILRKPLEAPAAVPTSSKTPNPDQNGDEEFYVLEQTEEEAAAPAAVSQKSGRTSRGRLSTASATNETASPSKQQEQVNDGPGVRNRRHDRRVSFDENVEWVQNDTEERQAVGMSFFLKAVLYGAILCLIVTVSLIAWADYMQDETVAQLSISAEHVTVATTNATADSPDEV